MNSADMQPHSPLFFYNHQTPYSKQQSAHCMTISYCKGLTIYFPVSLEHYRLSTNSGETEFDE